MYVTARAGQARKLRDTETEVSGHRGHRWSPGRHTMMFRGGSMRWPQRALQPLRYVSGAPLVPRISETIACSIKPLLDRANKAYIVPSY
jgi:hypothetical protein